MDRTSLPFKLVYKDLSGVRLKFSTATMKLPLFSDVDAKMASFIDAGYCAHATKFKCITHASQHCEFYQEASPVSNIIYTADRYTACN